MPVCGIIFLNCTKKTYQRQINTKKKGRKRKQNSVPFQLFHFQYRTLVTPFGMQPQSEIVGKLLIKRKENIPTFTLAFLNLRISSFIPINLIHFLIYIHSCFQAYNM